MAKVVVQIPTPLRLKNAFEDLLQVEAAKLGSPLVRTFFFSSPAIAATTCPLPPGSAAKCGENCLLPRKGMCQAASQAACWSGLGFSVYCLRVEGLDSSRASSPASECSCSTLEQNKADLKKSPRECSCSERSRFSRAKSLASERCCTTLCLHLLSLQRSVLK